jgi:vacuolar-type H+-ATPase subunit C/Vma6
MTERKQDLLSQLADLSEQAIQKLADAPGADRVLGALKGLGDRVDELQRRTKGYEELDRRLSALEKKVSGLSKSGSSTSKKS